MINNTSSSIRIKSIDYFIVYGFNSDWRQMVMLFFFLLCNASAVYSQVSSGCSGGGNQSGGLGGGGSNSSSGGSGTTVTINRVHSSDPNDILGPDGYDTTRKWVSIKDKLTYRVRFENNPQFATAPAQNVFVYLPVFPGLNINTVSIGSFGFGKYTFNVPENQNYYSTRLDLKDSIGLYVDFTAGIDVTQNQIFWVFRSIDPVTGLAPSDALKGFLPVNDTAINRFNDTLPKVGEGYVTFLINPKSELITGDTSSAKAKIIFDTNEEIPTNLWTNTIDAVAPVSKIEMATVIKDTINLFWTGKDDAGGAGIRDYSIYVSENSGPFTLYKRGINATQEYFVGTPGNSYCFFSLGTDQTGNLETMKKHCEMSAILSTAGPLPLKWLYFRGTKRETDVLLDWATSDEINTKLFNIQRSLDGRQFRQIGTIKAKGTGAGTTSYNFPDEEAFGLNVKTLFYRIQQVDMDGKNTYSNTIPITFNPNIQVFKVYPNPFNQVLTLLITTQQKPSASDFLAIYSLEGKQLYRKSLSKRVNNVGMPLTDLGFLPPGTYFLNTNLNGVLESIKIIKQ